MMARRSRVRDTTCYELLMEARESAFRGIKEVIQNGRDSASYDYMKAKEKQGVMNAAHVPEDVLDPSLRPSPTGPLSRRDSLLSPPRSTPTSALPLVPTALTPLSPLHIGPIIYPWEQDTTPKPGARGPVPRHLYEDPTPHLWGLPAAGRLRRHSDIYGGVNQQGNGGEDIYDLLQAIKDEGTLLQGRPYSPNLPTHGARQRPSTSDVTGDGGQGRRQRFVWRPRPGFPGALALAPAGTQAMLEQIKTAFTADLPCIPSLRRAASASTPAASLSPAPSSVLDAVTVQPILVQSSSSASGVPEPQAASGATPSLAPLVVPEAADDSPAPEEADVISSGPAVTDDTPHTPHTPSTAAPSPHGLRSVTAVAQAVKAARVWVGARGKVVHGQTVP